MNIKITEKVLTRISEVAALLLWDVEAIQVNLDNPFQLVSGNYSPIYINCRKVISNPAFMQTFTAFTRILLQDRQVKFEVVAGGETAGIPFAAYVAQSLSLPMVYVRKRAKEHGTASLVEGNIQKGERVLLVEDLITDAGSKLGFIKGIQAVGGFIENVIVLFDRLQGGREALEKQGIQLHAVTDMTTALAVARDANFLPKDHLKSVSEYLEDAREWSKKRGLLFK